MVIVVAVALFVRADDDDAIVDVIDDDAAAIDDVAGSREAEPDDANGDARLVHENQFNEFDIFLKKQ